jgi:hypothetical protein
MQPSCACCRHDQDITIKYACHIWVQGLAKNDPPTVAGATYLAAVTANRVGKQIIAALIDVSQDATWTGSGASGPAPCPALLLCLVGCTAWRAAVLGAAVLPKCRS